MDAGSRQSENESWTEESREAEGGWNASSREQDYQNQDRSAGSRSEFDDESREMGSRGMGNRDRETESGRSSSRDENMRDQSDMGTP